MDIPLDEGLGRMEANNITVKIRKDSLKVMCRGVVVLEGGLEGMVVPNQSTWGVVEGRTVNVELVKADGGVWPGVIKGQVSSSSSTSSKRHGRRRMQSGDVILEEEKERRAAVVEVSEDDTNEEGKRLGIVVRFDFQGSSTHQGDFIGLYEHHEGERCGGTKLLQDYLDFAFADEVEGATKGQVSLGVTINAIPSGPVVVHMVNRHGDILGSSNPFLLHEDDMAEEAQSCSYFFEAQANIRCYHLYLLATGEGKVSSFAVKQLGPSQYRITFLRDDRLFGLEVGPLEWGIDETSAEVLVMVSVATRAAGWVILL